MPNFAIHDGSTVQNVIVADSQEIAEEVTGLSAVETEGEPWIGWTMQTEGWRSPSPFPSWVWSGSEWEAPTPRPTTTGAWAWDEDAQEWIDVAPPEA